MDLFTGNCAVIHTPEPVARKEMIALGRRMYEKGFVIATDGNLSVRLGKDRFLVTRSGVCKGELTDRDLVVCDQFGKTVRGGKVSSEVLLHLAAYRLRPDVQAVIHAHPPVAVSFSLAEVSLSEALLPEVVMSLGTIPTTLFAAPSSPEGAEVVRDAILKHDAVILDRHGSLTVGRTLREAYDKLERIEFAAIVTYHARALGNVRPLSGEEMASVQKSIERYRGGAISEEKCPNCGSPIHKKSVSSASAQSDQWYGADLDRLAPLIRRVIEEGRM